MESQLQSITKPIGVMGDVPRLQMAGAPITIASKAQRWGENLVRIIGKEPMR